MVVPLSIMELTEQEVVQITLAICRFIMLFLMIITISISLYYNIQSFSDVIPPTTSTEGGHNSDPLSDEWVLWDSSNLFLLLPVAAYSNVFHHSIPALANPIRDKSMLLTTFIYTISLCLLFYLLVGIVVSYYFREHIHPASNLNWSTYIGSTGGGHNSDPSYRPMYARAISFFIVAFPALDVTSAFPLNAVCILYIIYIYDTYSYDYTLYVYSMHTLYTYSVYMLYIHSVM